MGFWLYCQMQIKILSEKSGTNIRRITGNLLESFYLYQVLCGEKETGASSVIDRDNDTSSSESFVGFPGYVINLFLS
jgi:hypothetical protein